MDDGSAQVVADVSHPVSVRRRAVATLIEQAASLAGAGFFVESSALMNAARALMNAVTSDATVIAIDGVRLKRES